MAYADGSRFDRFIVVIASPRIMQVEVECRVEESGEWSLRCPAGYFELAGESGQDRTANPAAILLAIVDAAIAVSECDDREHRIEQVVVNE